jgi:ABC-2 type transport system permease protein
MPAVYKKEFKSYFNSPVGYVFMAVFLIISGIFFALTDIFQGSGYFSPVLDNITFLFLILVPVLTMRILSEERNQKTDQLLLTSPLKLHEIVIGKYLAAVSIFLITLSITIIYPVILSFFGSISVMEIIGYYIGFSLMGSSFIALGVFISSLTDNQITAAMGTFGALLFIWFLDWMQQNMPTSAMLGLVFLIILIIAAALIIYNAAKNIYLSEIIGIIGTAAAIITYFIKKTLFEGLITKILAWISLLKRYDDFTLGLLDLSSIVFYITFSAAFVFLTVRMLDRRRWN